MVEESSTADVVAVNSDSHRSPLPGMTAVRSSGSFLLGGRPMWGQFTNYVVHTSAVGGLVEHSILVGAPRRSWLARDIGGLTAKNVYRSLAASLATGPHSPGQG
jgi:uncharacterized membrane protein YbhN (UPF0104 family)